MDEPSRIHRRPGRLVEADEVVRHGCLLPLSEQPEVTGRRPAQRIRASRHTPESRARSQVAGTGTLLSEEVVGVHELAQAEGEASAPDAAAEAVPQVLQTGDALVQVVPPRGREPLPIATGRRAPIGQSIEGVLDAPERDADRLRRADERHPAQDLAREAPLVPGSARAADEALGLVEMQGRDGRRRCGPPLGRR